MSHNHKMGSKLRVQCPSTRLTDRRPPYTSPGPMDLQLLDQTLAAADQPAFRARQVWEWAARGAAGYEQMTNLPAPLRAWLGENVPFSSLELREERRASDGTVKALFATADGRPLEAVLMRYRDGRNSICVSSQSGCPLTCTFCATGQMRFARNLTVAEIVDQALHFRRVAPVDHCVFMGMGEPMLNLENVLAACERLPDVGIAHRRTAISTVGWIPGIEALAAQDMPLRLALSLHAADEALRSELMPVNERYPLADVLDACRAFYERKRRRVFVEYVMLAGVNDRYEQAVALAKILSPTHPKPRGPGEPRMFKVNLIPFNPTDSAYEGSSRDSIAAFKGALEARGIQATVRLTRGRDIDAACGQLAANSASRSSAAS
jgi:23S rRNA (adenine2503-C2)-methyltransferase